MDDQGSKGKRICSWRSDLHMDHISCSRQHAELIWHDKALWIKDLNSTHGTYLAIASRRTQRLPPGTAVRVEADTELILVPFITMWQESPN